MCIARANWGNIQPTNDYSYLPQTVFAANNKVTVYYKGQLIWGTEPALLAIANALSVASAVVDSAASTTTAVQLYPNPVVDTLYVQVPQLRSGA